MTEEVRVRYAPSPTGQPHIGNIRTALFNWLFARRHGGRFIVRVEDTDQTREVPGAVENILESLRWLGIHWDEGPEVGGTFGPYFQAERLPVYQEAADYLTEQGYGYRCYCSPERLAEMRKEQQLKKETPGYDGQCLGLTKEERRQLEDAGGPSVVRFRMPDDEEIQVQDIIRGEVTWQSGLLDDFVILKSDGFPTYHLANVVDDHRMKISHVLRAEEWLSSTPRHLMLYRALELTPPQFGHLPMILGPDRSKLSKRHGATSALEYREEGYLPEALTNFMALLGWALDDKTELMSRETLKENFSLERVVKSGAIFNLEKLDWMNGMYIRELDANALADRLMDYWEKFPPEGIPPEVDGKYLLRIVPLIQERMKTLKDASGKVGFFFEEELRFDAAELVQKGMDEAGSREALRRAAEVLTLESEFDAAALEGRLRGLGEELGLSARQFFGLLRVATTGSQVSPPLFETMEVLGRERCLARIGAAAALGG